jgi:hypothetical protein
MSRILAMLPLLALLPLSARAEARDPAAEFSIGRRAFEQRRFKDAIRHLRPLLYPAILLSAEEQIVDAHRVLAISHFMNDDREAARREFVSLLGYRPDYMLDPIAEPAAVVSFFESVKRELEERARANRERQLRAETRRRIEEELSQRPAGLTDRPQMVERVIDRRARLPLFIPFGYGQFDNGQPRKGWMFLTLEGALAITSISAWSAIQIKYPGSLLERHYPRESAETAAALVTTQWVTGGLFFAVAVWGILDALVCAPPRETVVIKEPRSPGLSPRTRLSLTPSGIVVEGGF